MSIHDKYAELLKEYNDLKEAFDTNSQQLESVITELEFWKSQASQWKQEYNSLLSELRNG